MAIYLNSTSAYIDFNMLVHDAFFVDKSGIIEKINARINTKNRYVCITKPRRFGKTSILNMLGAYYCSAYDSRELFDGLEGSKCRTFAEHLNKYNVINLCLNALPDEGESYDDYIGMIRNSLKKDIREAYPHLKTEDYYSLPDILAATQDQFIFIIDEWDYIFSHNLFPESLINGHCRSYWTRMGKMDEVLFFLKYNISEVRDDVVKMVNNIPVRIDIEEEYSAGQESPRNREEIYSAMIIYGLLSYHDGELRIPNKELMIEFEKALKDNDFGYVAE